MYSFTNDYSEGAHPKIMDAILRSNYEQSAGYGMDEYCQAASQEIKRAIDCENCDIHYLVGGTQTNTTFIASALRPHQAVIAVDSAHINVHETGAIEATGHKILTCGHKEGKINVEMINNILAEHTDEHMVQPKMVYISQSTEYGSVYYLDEFLAIAKLCREKDLLLFVDGARLGSALAVDGTPTLAQLAQYSDAFYIGGTKMGALFGECLVIINETLKQDFRFHIKQRGGMLAKGRLLGIQFKELFANDLYFKIGKYENEMADILRIGLQQFPMYVQSLTNQLFPILPDDLITYLQTEYSFNIVHRVDNNHQCIRLVTSWATPKEAVEGLINKIASYYHHD